MALFWGKKDGLVPLEIGYETKALLESSTQTYLVTFDEFWHEPFITQKELFVTEVIKFVSQ